jgi:hypothetical protein
MKILFLLLLVSFSAMASNWMPLSVIQSRGVSAFSLESDCSKTGEQCFDVGVSPEAVKLGYYSIENEMIDDHSAPIWGSRSMVEACSGESDCQAKALAKECTGGREPFYNAEYSETWCNKIVGYEKIASGRKTFSIDQAALQSYKNIEYSKAQLEAGIQMAQRLQNCGERVMALMLVRNQPKKLSTGQVKQLVAVYSNIKELLESGSLLSAKEEIQSVSADGVLVTENDKAALTQELDKCLGI